MAEDLYRLVYYSKNRIAEEIAREIDLILAASRRNNLSLGVTGARVFNRGMFAQVLEGERPAIEVVFERIQQDPRHAEVQVLAFDPVTERVFPHWSMAFLGQSREDEDLFGHIGPDTNFSMAQIEGHRILEVIRAIAREEEFRAHT